MWTFLRTNGERKYQALSDVVFNHDRVALNTVLEASIAMTSLLHFDERHWRLFV